MVLQGDCALQIFSYMYSNWSRVKQATPSSRGDNYISVCGWIIYSICSSVSFRAPCRLLFWRIDMKSGSLFFPPPNLDTLNYRFNVNTAFRSNSKEGRDGSIHVIKHTVKAELYDYTDCYVRTKTVRIHKLGLITLNTVWHLPSMTVCWSGSYVCW